ncbi:MAG: hypothetical protein ACR2M0_16875 [Chloroflexia bacterium]
MKSNLGIARLLGILALLGLVLGAPGMSQAQSGSRTFPQTGKTVAGNFLTYWDGHGGLAQQGYPISDEIQEKSDLNGQTYGVQYFERAVFEHHPENQPPFDVLLSQLGTYRYKAKYGDAGAPDQHASTDNPRVFKETGHAIGGKFRTYWESHGGLAQQGFPISDEFTEVSDLNHQPYTVQYFERAVFELHTENAGTPFEVLLSQLGTFQYRCKYQGGPCVGGSASPTATPQAAAPTNTPAPSGPDCSGIPASANVVVTPNCAPAGSRFDFVASGFKPSETVGIYVTLPDGKVSGAPFQVNGEPDGRVTGIYVPTRPDAPTGIWAITYEGLSTHAKAIGYFKVTGPGQPSASCDTSGDKDGSSTPSSGKVGDTLIFHATGFAPNEAASFWFTTPHGDVVGTRAPASGLVDGSGSITLPFPIDSALAQIPGRWAITFQGASSQHQSVIFFCVGP